MSQALPLATEGSHLSQRFDKDLEDACAEVQAAKDLATSSLGIEPEEVTVCSQVAVRTSLAAAVGACASRLEKTAWMKRLLKTGDYLRKLGEVEAAKTLCYDVCIQKGYSEGFCDDGSLARDVAAAYGQSLCELELIRRSDPFCKYPQNVRRIVEALLDVQRAMERILTSDNDTTENLYWLVYNGTIHTHNIAKFLATNGFASRAVEFLNYSVLACEAVINLATVRYLPWRTTLYTAVVTCYMLAGDYARAWAAASRGLAQTEELYRLEKLDPPVPRDVENKFEKCIARLNLLKGSAGGRARAAVSSEIFKECAPTSIRVQLDMLAEALQGRGRSKWGLSQIDLEEERNNVSDLLLQLPRGPTAAKALIKEHITPQTLLSLLIASFRYEQAAAFDVILIAAKRACNSSKSEASETEKALVKILQKLQQLRLLDNDAKAKAEVQRNEALNANTSWGSKPAAVTEEEEEEKVEEEEKDNGAEEEKEENTAVEDAVNEEGETKGDDHGEDVNNDVPVANSRPSSVSRRGSKSSRKRVMVIEDDETDMGIQYFDGGKQIPEKTLRTLSACLLKISRDPESSKDTTLYSEILGEALRRLWLSYGAKVVSYLDRLGAQLPPTWIVKIARDMLLAIYELGTKLNLDAPLLRAVVSLRLGRLLASPNMMLLDLRKAISVLRNAIEVMRLDQSEQFSHQVHVPRSPDDVAALSYVSASSLFPPEMSVSDRLGLGGYGGTGVFGSGSHIYPLDQAVTNLYMELVAAMLHCELRLGQQLSIDVAIHRAAKADEKARQKQKALSAMGGSAKSIKTGKSTTRGKGTSAGNGGKKSNALENVKGNNATESDAVGGDPKSVVDQSTEQGLMALCGKNRAWKALLYIRLAEAQPDEERKIPYFERCAMELMQARKEDEALLEQLKNDENEDGNDNAETKVPRAPKFVSRNPNAIVLQIQPFKPVTENNAAWDTKVIEVDHFRVYCKTVSSGTNVTMNNKEFSGCDAPIPTTQKTVEISGLTPNERYSFAVAAFDREGNVINGIGRTTPSAVTAMLPLPLLLIWGRLCEASRGKHTPTARQAANILFNHFVYTKPSRPLWWTNPLCDFVLRRDWVKVTSVPVLRSLILGTHTLVETDGADTKIISLLAANPPKALLGTQIRILQMLGRLLIAIDVAVAIDDVPLIIESITRSYCLTIRLLQLRKRGPWIIPILAMSYRAGRLVPTELGDAAFRSVMLCITFELLNTIRAVGELSSVNKILKDIPNIPGHRDGEASEPLSEYRSLLNFIRAQSDFASKLELLPEPEPRVTVIKNDMEGLSEDNQDKGIDGGNEDELVESRPTTSFSKEESTIAKMGDEEKSKFEEALTSNLWTKLHKNPKNAFQWVKERFYNDPMVAELVARIVTVALEKQGGLELYVKSWLSSVPDHISNYIDPLPLTKLVLEHEDINAAYAIRAEQQKRKAAEAAKNAAVAASNAAEDAERLASDAGLAADEAVPREDDGEENLDKEGDQTSSPEEQRKEKTEKWKKTDSKMDEENKEVEEYNDVIEDLDDMRVPDEEERYQLKWLSRISILKGLCKFRLLAKRAVFEKADDGPSWDLAEAVQNSIETILPLYERPIATMTIPRDVQEEVSNIVNEDENVNVENEEEGSKEVALATGTDEKVDMNVVLSDIFKNLATGARRARWAHAWQQVQVSCKFMWNALWYAWISPRDFELRRAEFSFGDEDDVRPGVFSCDEFQLASTCLLDMLSLLSMPPEAYREDENDGDDAEGAREEMYDEEDDFSDASSLSSRASLDSDAAALSSSTGALSEVDTPWVGHFVLFTIKALYCAERWKEAVALGERLIGISIMRKLCAESVLPVVVLSQKQLHKIATRNQKNAEDEMEAFRQRERDRFNNMSSKEKRKRKMHLGGTYESEADKAAKIEEAELQKILDEKKLLSGSQGTGGHLQSLELQVSNIARDKSVGLEAIALSRVLAQQYLMQAAGLLAKDPLKVDSSKKKKKNSIGKDDKRALAVIEQYEQTVSILRQRREQELLVQALNELGDFHFMLAHGMVNEDTRLAWSDGVDAVFSQYDSMLNWRNLIAKMKRGKNDGGSAVLAELGLFETLTGVVLLAKLGQHTLGNDLHLCIEHTLCASELFSAIFKCSLPHPPRLCDFTPYSAAELWPSLDIFSQPERMSPSILMRALSYLIQQLLRSKLPRKALPLICAFEYLARDVCREVRTTARARLMRLEALILLGDLSEALNVMCTLSCARCRGAAAEEGSGVFAGADLPSSLRERPVYNPAKANVAVPKEKENEELSNADAETDEGNEADDKKTNLSVAPTFLNYLPPEHEKNNAAIEWLSADPGPPPLLVETYGRNITHDLQIQRIRLLVRLATLPEKRMSGEKGSDEDVNEKEHESSSARNKILSAAWNLCDKLERSLLREKSQEEEEADRLREAAEAELDPESEEGLAVAKRKKLERLSRGIEKRNPIENAAEMGALCNLLLLRADISKLHGDLTGASFYVRQAMKQFQKDAERFKLQVAKLFEKQLENGKSVEGVAGADVGFGFDPNGDDPDYEDGDVLGLSFWLQCRAYLASLLLSKGSGYYNAALAHCRLGLLEAEAKNEAVFVRQLRALSAKLYIAKGLLNKAASELKALLEQDVARHWSDVVHAEAAAVYGDLLIEMAKMEMPDKVLELQSEAIAYYSLSEQVLEAHLRQYGWRGFVESEPTMLSSVYFPGTLMLAKVKLRLAMWLPKVPTLKKVSEDEMKQGDSEIEIDVDEATESESSLTELICATDEGLERAMEGLQTLRHIVRPSAELLAELLFHLGRLRRQRLEIVRAADAAAKRREEEKAAARAAARALAVETGKMTPEEAAAEDEAERDAKRTVLMMNEREKMAAEATKEVYNPGPYSVEGVQYSDCVPAADGGPTRKWVRALPHEIIQSSVNGEQSLLFVVKDEPKDSDIYIAVAALEACLRVSTTIGCHNRRLLFSACMELVTVLGNSENSQQCNAASYYLRTAAKFGSMMKTLTCDVHTIGKVLSDNGAGLPHSFLERSLKSCKAAALADSKADSDGGEEEESNVELEESTEHEISSQSAEVDTKGNDAPPSRKDVIEHLQMLLEKNPKLNSVLSRSSIYQFIALQRKIVLCNFSSNFEISLATDMHFYLKENCEKYKTECCIDKVPIYVESMNENAQSENGLVRVQWYSPSTHPMKVFMYCVIVEKEAEEDPEEEGEEGGKVKANATLLKLPISIKDCVTIQRRLRGISHRLRIAAFASTEKGADRRGGGEEAIKELNSEFSKCLQSISELFSGTDDVKESMLECTQENVDILNQLFDVDVGIDVTRPDLCRFLKSCLSK
eukprot:g4152.t1